jgi:hypothetical protein
MQCRFSRLWVWHPTRGDCRRRALWRSRVLVAVDARLVPLDRLKGPFAATTRNLDQECASIGRSALPVRHVQRASTERRRRTPNGMAKDPCPFPRPVIFVLRNAQTLESPLQKKFVQVGKLPVVLHSKYSVRVYGQSWVIDQGGFHGAFGREDSNEYIQGLPLRRCRSWRSICRTI